MAYGTSSTGSTSSISTTGTTTGPSVGKSADGLTSDQKVNKVFDQYFTSSQNFPSNEVDAVVGFFENRGFEKTAAVSTATTLLSQARLDNVNVFELLDTLKGLESVQISA